MRMLQNLVSVIIIITDLPVWLRLALAVRALSWLVVLQGSTLQSMKVCQATGFVVSSVGDQ